MIIIDFNGQPCELQLILTKGEANYKNEKINHWAYEIERSQSVDYFSLLSKVISNIC